MKYIINKNDRYIHVINEIGEANIPTKVKNDILSYIESLQNYGTDICFEISPRNVAVKNGRLILLDCFFMQSQLNKARTGKR